MVCNWGLSLHWLKWDLSSSQRSYCRWKTIKIFIFHRYLYCVYKYAFLYWNIFNYGKEKKFCIIGCVKFNQICIHSKKESIFQYWPKLIEHLHGNAPVWSSSLFEIATSNFKCLNDLHMKIGKMGKEKPPILDFSTPREDKLIINLEFNNFFIINFLYKDSYLKHLIFQININNI